MLSIERLSLEDAHVLIEGATTKANEISVPMCIAIMDESGRLIAFNRMDGVKALSIEVSQDKALTAAVSRKSTQFYNEQAVEGKPLFGIQASWGGHFSTVGGGVPVEVDGVVVGGIGLSGGTPAQDIACAEAAIDYLITS